MKVPPNRNINVVVERSSNEGKWFAKMGKNAEGHEAMVFYQRPGKQSLFQKLLGGLTGVYSGKQAAKQYLKNFGWDNGSSADLNQHIKKLETMTGNSNSITQVTPHSKKGKVKYEVTEKISFHTEIKFKLQNETKEQQKKGLEQAFTILKENYGWSKDKIASTYKKPNMVENILTNTFDSNVIQNISRESSDDLNKIAVLVRRLRDTIKLNSKEANTQELDEIDQRLRFTGSAFYRQLSKTESPT